MCPPADRQHPNRFPCARQRLVPPPISRQTQPDPQGLFREHSPAGQVGDGSGGGSDDDYASPVLTLPGTGRGVLAHRVVRLLAPALAVFALLTRRTRFLGRAVAPVLPGGRVSEAEQTERATEQRAQRAAAGASVVKARVRASNPDYPLERTLLSAKPRD